MRRAEIAFMCLVIFAIVGCSKEYKVDVRSDTSWSGYFDDRTVDGEGNKTVNLTGDPPQCISVQKDTEEGYLTIQFKEEGGGILNSTNDYDPLTTTAEYGIVSGCTKD